MAKYVSLDCSVYFPMEDDEERRQAEDRLLQVLEDAGIHLVAWWNVEIEDGGENG